MTGTHTGPFRWRHARKPQAWAPIGAAEKHTPPAASPAVRPEVPALTEALIRGKEPDTLEAAGGPTVWGGKFAQWAAAARSHDDFLAAILGNAPEGWVTADAGEEITQDGALRYVRFLEAEMDRHGYSRKPPGCGGAADAGLQLLPAVVAALGYYPHPSFPVPPRTAPGTPDAAPGATSPPAGEDSGPTPADASPVAPGAVSTEDEPVAEQDCAEGSDGNA